MVNSTQELQVDPLSITTTLHRYFTHVLLTRRLIRCYQETINFIVQEARGLLEAVISMGKNSIKLYKEHTLLSVLAEITAAVDKQHTCASTGPTSFILYLKYLRINDSPFGFIALCLLDFSFKDLFSLNPPPLPFCFGFSCSLNSFLNFLLCCLGVSFFELQRW